MDERYFGYARCHPHCHWRIVADAHDYDFCWLLLKAAVSRLEPVDDLLISMVVLPSMDRPVERTAGKRRRR